MSLGPGHFGDDGAQRVVDMAGRLGIDTSKLSRGAVADARHVEHERRSTWREAYSVFANDGVHRTPRFVTKIVGPDGKVIYQADTAGQAGAARAGRAHRDRDAHRA